LAWVLGGLAVWLVLGFLVAVVIGRGIRLADRMDERATDLDLASAALLEPAALRAARLEAPARRRAIPMSPFGIALVAVAVALETGGFLLRTTGASGQLARSFSMDAPLSLPRMYVTALFAAAALLAVAGGGRMPGRRAWWGAVALVGAGIASVKAGSTVHAEALGALQDAVGTPVALLLSAMVAGAVLAALLILSRGDRRDRRRIVGILALYAGASVGLSALSGAVGPDWVASATFVEETGEALAGVGFLLAVLAGVAPRLALPTAWPLRRTADANTIEVVDPAAGRAASADAPR